MAFTTSQVNRHEQPLGGGYRGLRKVFHTKLVAATPKTVYFDGFKLNDVDNLYIDFGATHVNGSAESCGGTPATTITLAADGKSITLTHSANMNCVFEIAGDWVAI
jgi:hypothetical protein